MYSTLALEKETEIVKEETAFRKEKEAVCCYVHVHVHVDAFYCYVYTVRVKKTFPKTFGIVL